MSLDKKQFSKYLKEGANTMNESLHGKIYSENPKEPKNPEVLVLGMYRMSFNSIKSEIKDTLKRVIQNVDENNFSQAITLLDGLFSGSKKDVGVVSHQIRALQDALAEMDSKKK